MTWPTVGEDIHHRHRRRDPLRVLWRWRPRRRVPRVRGVNGTRTEFTLDVASSLTNVLAETTTGSTISYLYGLGLVGEMKTSVGMAEYHLTDALGSVRQLTDPGGRVLLSQTFDPYGNRYEQSSIVNRQSTIVNDQ